MRWLRFVCLYGLCWSRLLRKQINIDLKALVGRRILGADAFTVAPVGISIGMTAFGVIFNSENAGFVSFGLDIDFEIASGNQFEGIAFQFFISAFSDIKSGIFGVCLDIKG